MKPDHYKCIKSESKGEYKEKGSKFLAFAYPVSTETEIKILLDRFKKEYYDARHICYAYILGTEEVVMKSSDAGEPSGTAGLPILNQLRSFDLKNVILVVVRYFGGTKLGTSGLVSAYKSVAKEAMENSEFIEKPITEELSIRFDYVKMNTVMRWLKEMDALILEQTFSEQECILRIALLKSHKKVLLDKLRE